VRLDVAQVTAWGTVGLVVVTLVYVWFTGGIAKRAGESAASAERSARAAEHAVDLARLQLMIAQMPKVRLTVDVDAGYIDGELDQMTVTYDNEGRNRAVEVDVRVGGELAGDHPMRLFALPSVSPGGHASRAVDVTERPASDVITALRDERPIELYAAYGDDFGNRFRTGVQVIPRERGDGQPIARSGRRWIEYDDGAAWRPLRLPPTRAHLEE
jgi:hypothetical protein